MSKDLEIVKPGESLAVAQKLEPNALAVKPTGGLSIEQAWEAVKGGMSVQQVEVMKTLLQMDAAQKFDHAFAELQSELPTIVASTVISNRGKYEKYEDIMAVVQPLLTKHRFTVRFENDFRENRIGEKCILSHAGHERATTYWTRAGGKSDSETQADSKAATTARRNALIRALNITIRQDALIDEDDPRNEGTTVTPSQAFELERRVKETNSDMRKFLDVAQAKSFEEILSGKYPTLDSMLRTKERAGR